MVAETTFVDNDTMIGQIFYFLDFNRINLLVQHTMRKNLDNRLTVLSVFVMEMGIHTAHQVSMSVL